MSSYGKSLGKLVKFITLVKLFTINIKISIVLMKKLLVFILFVFQLSFSQDISLYNQFNGRYDFTFVGNTLNTNENSFQFFPEVLTTSDATLTLNSGDVIESAYLYWAGCGTGDFDIKLN